MSIPGLESKRVVVVIPEAKNKCIQELRIEEPEANSEEFWVSISFDDETVLILDLSARLRFGVDYFQRAEGEWERVMHYPKRILRY